MWEVISSLITDYHTSQLSWLISDTRMIITYSSSWNSWRNVEAPERGDIPQHPLKHRDPANVSQTLFTKGTFLYCIRYEMKWLLQETIKGARKAEGMETHSPSKSWSLQVKMCNFIFKQATQKNRTGLFCSLRKIDESNHPWREIAQLLKRSLQLSSLKNQLFFISDPICDDTIAKRSENKVLERTITCLDCCETS